MDKKFNWKAEISFKGTPAEFKKLTEMLEKAPVEVKIPEWGDLPHHLAGCSRIRLERILRDDFLEKIIVDMPRFPIKFPIPIPGGIRSPHIHLGRDIVLLEPERFRTYAAAIATELATMLVDIEGDDYVEVMGPINSLADNLGPIS